MRKEGKIEREVLRIMEREKKEKKEERERKMQDLGLKEGNIESSRK